MASIFSRRDGIGLETSEFLPRRTVDATALAAAEFI
jgi:hypothetical protein